MTQVTINGITYATKKEAVLAIKPDAYMKSGTYVTYIDSEKRSDYLQKARNTMRKRYQEDLEYRERQKKRCRERYIKKKMDKVTRG